MTVAAILRQKGPDVASVRPTTTISELARLLTERRIGAVVVRDAAHHLLGIVSERDVIHAIAAHGAATLEMSAAQLMTANVTTVAPAASVEEAMAIMSSGRFRHLPVMDGGVLLGIISIGDVVKTRIMQQDQEVDSLKAYVAGA